MHDPYVLHIASWYPHEESPFEGDFVERHIRCISNKVSSVVYFSKAVLKPKSKLEISEASNCVIYRRLYQRAGALSNYSKYHALAYPDIKHILEQKGKPIAIHCHAGYPGLSLSVALADKYQLPLIFTEHSTIYQQEKLSFKEKLILRYLKKYSAKADVTCPVSIAHSQSMQRKCKLKRSEVIHNVVTNPFFETLLKKSKSPHKLLHISSLDDDQKNITDILKGFSLASIQRPNLSLTLVGNTNIKLVKRLIKRLKIDTTNIKIIGPLEHSQIPKLMTEHDLFLLWSRYESFSLVIAESWASGLPVISNNSGGITSTINDELGKLALDYTPTGLAQSIIETLDRYSNFDLISIREHAKSEFSEIQISKKYIDLYNSLGIL